MKNLLLRTSNKKNESNRKTKRERNQRDFDNVELSNQELKTVFLIIFLEWIKGGLENVSMFMVDFVDWLGCK